MELQRFDDLVCETAQFTALTKSVSKNWKRNTGTSKNICVATESALSDYLCRICKCPRRIFTFICQNHTQTFGRFSKKMYLCARF